MTREESEAIARDVLNHVRGMGIKHGFHGAVVLFFPADDGNSHTYAAGSGSDLETCRMLHMAIETLERGAAAEFPLETKNSC